MRQRIIVAKKRIRCVHLPPLLIVGGDSNSLLNQPVADLFRLPKDLRRLNAGPLDNRPQRNSLLLEILLSSLYMSVERPDNSVLELRERRFLPSPFDSL